MPRLTHILACTLALGGGVTFLPTDASVTDTTAFDVPGLVIVWAAGEGGAAPVVSDFIVADGAGSTDLIPTDGQTVVTGTLISTAETPGTAAGTFGGTPFIIENTPVGDINTDTNGDGTLNAADAFSSFGLQIDSDTDISTAATTTTSFFVASNTNFNVTAELIDVEAGGFLTISGPPPSFAAFIFGLFGLEDPAFLASVFLDASVSLAPTGPGEINFGSAAQPPNSGGPTSGFTGLPASLFSLSGGPDLIFVGDQATASTPGSIVDQSVRFDLAYSVGLDGYDLSLGVFDFTAVMEYTVFVP